MEHDDLLLDRAARDQPIDRHRLRLADAVRAIGRLILDGGVPPGIEMDDVVGGRQVDAGAAGLERDQESVALTRLEAVDQRGALTWRCRAIEVKRLEAGLVECLADERQVRRELAEHERAVAFAAQLLEQLDRAAKLR